jgi:hypothetical protein
VRRIASPQVAFGLGVLSVILVLAAIPVEVLNPGTMSFNASSDAFSILTSVAFLLAFAAAGVVVARNQPRNPIGWLLLAIALVWEIGDFAPGYADLDYQYRHGSLPLGHVALLAYAANGLFYGLLIFPVIVLLFPDGRLSRRWRWPLVVYLVICISEVAATLSVAVGDFGRRDPLDSSGNLIGLSVQHSLAAHVEALALLAAFLMLMTAVVHQIIAFRRASGERREQLKWLMSGAALCLLIAPTFLIQNEPAVLSALFPLVLTAIPVTIGIGIVKYRLYEIDRIVSRTLSYAVLTALLVGTFVALIELTTQLLPFSSTVAVAASTLAAAALFNPLRVRIQRRVDHRFNRSRYDAEATVAAFAARLRDAVDVDAVERDLLSTVGRAVEPSHATVWMRQRG